MKKILLILISLLLTMSALVACNSSQLFIYQYAEQPSELSEDWEIVLAEYLAQFSPVFHDIRRVRIGMGLGWFSNWEDFIERIDISENHRYGYTYIFRDPITGERLMIDDTPFLNQRSGIWYNDNGESQTWSRTEIAARFDLFDFDGSGIPYLVIYWHSPDNEPIEAVTLHRFQNGAYEFVKELSTYRGISFFRADDGRLFISYHSTVAAMIDIRLLCLDDEITITPVLSTDSWTGTVHNYLTGEYFGRDEPWGRILGIDNTDSWEEMLVELLGFSVTQIEPLTDLQARLIEYISAR